MEVILLSVGFSLICLLAEKKGKELANRITDKVLDSPSTLKAKKVEKRNSLLAERQEEETRRLLEKASSGLYRGSYDD